MSGHRSRVIFPKSESCRPSANSDRRPSYFTRGHDTAHQRHLVNITPRPDIDHRYKQSAGVRSRVVGNLKYHAIITHSHAMTAREISPHSTHIAMDGRRFSFGKLVDRLDDLAGTLPGYSLERLDCSPVELYSVHPSSCLISSSPTKASRLSSFTSSKASRNSLRSSSVKSRP